MQPQFLLHHDASRCLQRQALFQKEDRAAFQSASAPGQVFFPLLPSKQSLFTSCLDEFPQLESFYTEICIYQIIHESIQVSSFFSHSFIESSYSESSYS